MKSTEKNLPYMRSKTIIIIVIITNFNLKVHQRGFENMLIYSSSHKRIFQSFHIIATFSFFEICRFLMSEMFVHKITEITEYFTK